MATFKSFEDIEAWQKAKILNNEIFLLIDNGCFKKDFDLIKQINSSAASIMDNIAEGFERSGTYEFIQFLGFSKGSCGEVKSQLHRALDRKYITEEKFSELYKQANDIGKMLRALIEYLNKSDIKGEKFKHRDLTKNKKL